MNMIRNYRNNLGDCIFLICVVAIVYGRLTSCAFQTTWDDNIYILNSSFFLDMNWFNLKEAFTSSTQRIGQYNPIALLSFMVDHRLWGLNPSGFHLTNIIIHGMNGMLIYWLLLRIYNKRLIALVAATFFLVHPVQVESVAWIAERKDLLATFFVIISWRMYLRYSEAGAKQGRAAYALSLSAFLLSLLAKPSCVFFPLILIAIDLCFPNKVNSFRFKDKIPFFVLSGIITAVAIFSEKPVNDNPISSYHGGSPLATFYTMLTVFCRYLYLLAWPSELNILHNPKKFSSLSMPVVLSAVLLVCVFCVGIYVFKKDRKTGFWFALFWIALLPVSQIIPIVQLMYEHYLYFPIIGVATFVGICAVYIQQRIQKKFTVLLYGGITGWLLALSVISYHRCEVWQDSQTLFTDSTNKAPNYSWTWELLAVAQNQAGKTGLSIQSFERSIALNPMNIDALWMLANLYTEQGELDKGYNLIQKIFKINPAHVQAWASLGNNYVSRHNYPEAEKAYLKALSLQPDAVPVIASLGNLAKMQKHFDQARYYFNQIENHHWDVVENAYRLTCLESLAGHKDEAISWLEKALNHGYSDYDELNTNMELETLWNDPRYAVLMLQYFPEQEKSQ